MGFFWVLGSIYGIFVDSRVFFCIVFVYLEARCTFFDIYNITCHKKDNGI